MKRFLFIITIFFAMSCDKKVEKGINYFDFDELEYYHKNISKKEILNEYVKSKTIGYDKDYLRIVENEYPQKLVDTTFANKLIKFGYKEKLIDKSKYEQINQVFSRNECTELTTIGCIPIYRDIFVFKRKRKIIGIAKVCFECRTAHIIGSSQNWDYFGECGNYEKLQDIIK